MVCRAFKGLGSETSQISFIAWTRARPGDDTVLVGFTFTFSKVAESGFFVLGIGMAWTRTRPGDETVGDGFTFIFTEIAEFGFFVLGIGLGGEGGLILLI